MNEAVSRKDIGVRREELRGELTTWFELEVEDSQEFVRKVEEHLGQLFDDSSSIVVEGGAENSEGEFIPVRLETHKGLLRNSYVAVDADQITGFRVTENRAGDKALGFTLYDTGMPYVDGPVVPSQGLHALRTTRDGIVNIKFFEDPRYQLGQIAEVNITGQNRGTLINVAMGYLRGLKAGQESSS
jgi:hypothetical protein